MNSTATPQQDVQDGPAANTVTYTLRSKGLWLVIGLMLVISAIAEAIGDFTIPLGAAALTLLPMIWGLLMGLLISAQRIRPLPVALQNAATVVMGVAVLWLCARLSLTLGPNIPIILEAGPALLLQELGNVFGAILLALPLAVLLRMGPATVGATFSIDREGAFAMVSERFGSGSQQYRGVLSMYIFGTLFGAVIISVIASLVDSFGVFDPLALAMGAGMGSGSMLAAGSAVLAAAHPEVADQVVAIATTANVIAALLGVYLGVWVSLPIADRFYKLLTKRQRSRAVDATVKSATDLHATASEGPQAKVPLWVSLLVLSCAGIIVTIIGSGAFSADVLVSYLLMAALTAGSIGLARLTRGKIPGIVVVFTLGALLTSPISPVADWILATTAPVDFLSVITVMLSVAGLTLGKDLPMLKNIGWKILPVGTVVITATFLASAVIAEFVLGYWG